MHSRNKKACGWLRPRLELQLEYVVVGGWGVMQPLRCLPPSWQGEPIERASGMASPISPLAASWASLDGTIVGPLRLLAVANPAGWGFREFSYLEIGAPSMFAVPVKPVPLANFHQPEWFDFSSPHPTMRSAAAQTVVICPCRADWRPTASTFADKNSATTPLSDVAPVLC